ncbi:MAG: Fic family protein [Bacteroidetes bacterium]|nr:Fic family protein [Bacteroidota bacterium]
MKLPEPVPDFREVLGQQKSSFFVDLISDAELNKKLHEIDKDYPYWEQFKYKAKSITNYTPEAVWIFNRIYREKSINKIKICDSKGFEFKFNTPVKIIKYLHEFDLNLGGTLEGRVIIPPDDKPKYLISSIMEEAIASSQLEGAATTREIAKQMLRTNRKPSNISEKMILNNYVTIKKVLEIKDKKISKELILELHSLISKDTLLDKSNEGIFRTRDDITVGDEITGETYYTPPSHVEIEKLMDAFCKFANSENESEFIHPIIKGIILHFLIGYIHPFVDGNGRTARAIFYWYLISKGYWLVEYMSISKIIIRAPAQYGRAYLYSEYDNNDLTYFILYNLKCMDLALKNFKAYIERKVMEKQNMFYLIKNANINERQSEILRGMIIDNQKSFTIKEVQTIFATVYQTARTDLLGLVDLGFLTEKKMGKKLIFFKADDFEDKIKNITSSNKLF